MNASDIVKNRQNKVLYRANYAPKVFQSTVVTTQIPISSYVGGFNSYSSITNTVYTYSAQPTFLSYELLNDVNDGKNACTGTCTSQVSWTNLMSTTQYLYSVNYSTLSTPLNIGVTSTIVKGSEGPVISPLVNFYQGTYADSTYPRVNEVNMKY